MNKGVVVTDKITIDNGDFHGVVPFTDDDLRFCLLFWDKIAFPFLWIYRQRYTDDFLYLCDIGIGMRHTGDLIKNKLSPEIDDYLYNNQREFRKFTMEHNIVAAQQTMCKALNKFDSDSEWSIVQFSEKLITPEENVIKETIEFQLLNAIRHPTKTVPLDDILLFKERRRSELLALTEIIECITMKILISEEPVKAFKKQSKILKSKLDDYNKVLDETRYPTILSNLKNFMGSPAIGLAGLAGMIPELSSQMELINGSALTTASLAIGYKMIASSDDNKAVNSPFAYLANAKRELI